MTFKKLNYKVLEWAKNKGIMSKATPFSQHTKTVEEIEELSEAITAQAAGLEEYHNENGVLKNTDEEIEDAIGDILVTLIIQAKMQGLTIEQCLETAYNIISKRTGKMVDGIFVKDN